MPAPYEPTPFLSAEPTLREMADWATPEFRKIAESMSETQAVDLRPVFAAPLRPREGMIVFADGTTWNPGSGAGAYERRGGVWVKL